MQKLNMNHVARKNINEAKLKKAFRIKLFEFCKTRTMKSSPDLFNFQVISAGYDMANDAGRATTCRCNFKAPWLQTERTKTEEPSEKMSFNWETGWRFQTKKNQRFHSSHREQNKKTTRPQYRKLNMNHVATKILTEANLKKAFRINDAGRAITCRRNFKAPGLQTEGTKKEGSPEKKNFNAETVWKFQTKKNQKIQSSYGE